MQDIRIISEDLYGANLEAPKLKSSLIVHTGTKIGQEGLMKG